MAAAKPTTVLVTGGAGYIGSHAAKVLSQAGHRVVIYDNLSAGHREAVLGAPLIVGDTGDVETMRRAIRDSGASAVMHFAAWLSVPDSVRDPAGYYRNNVTGTIGTLAAMNADIEHIAIADGINLLLVAPCTANVIGKFANGIADDFLSSLYLATRAPVMLAPAMNSNMLAHDAVQRNLQTLTARGVKFVEPGEGYLA